MRTHRRRVWGHLLVAIVTLFATLQLAAPAAAADEIMVTATPTSPLVGAPVTFTATIARCGNWDWTFSVDGAAPLPPDQELDHGVTAVKQVAFAAAGTHVVKVTAFQGDCGSATGEISVVVGNATGGSISSNPDPPLVNQPATIGAVPTGGFGPYSYAWDSDNDGNFDNEQTRAFSRTFTTAGPRTMRVQVTDSATPANQWVITRTLVVDANTPPPPPPPCTSRVAFALSEFTTTGCFTRTGNTWSSTDEVKLNGLSLGDLGQKVTIDLPTTAEPGGHLTAANASLILGDTAVYSGPVDWTLPNGSSGDEKSVRSLDVPAYARYVGLKVVGSAALRIGITAAQKSYATVTLNINLPAIFQPGPAADSGRVTLTGSVRVDAQGPHFDGMQLRAKDIYVGRGMRARELCFSAVKAGGQTLSPCPAPTLDGQPYLECATNTQLDRWEISGLLQYPDPMTMQVAVFGTLSGGQLTQLGGFVNDSVIPLQLMPGVAINRIGTGVCVDPAPLQVRGDVGAAIAQVIQVNGRFVYTDPTQLDPWKVSIGGNVAVGDIQFGDGSVNFNATGQTTFALNTDADVLGVASLNGSLNGWVEPAVNRFNIYGTVNGCLVDVLCADASAMVSSTGLGACINAGTLVVYEPVNARVGSFGGGSISFSTRRVEVPLKAGFGYRYGTDYVDLLGNSCDFGPYSATRSMRASESWARTGAPAPTVRIERGTRAVTMLIKGTSGAPKIALRGPDGTVIESSATAPGVRGKRFLIVENATNGTTSVLLQKPAAGNWELTALPTSTSQPASVSLSAAQAPPMFVGRTRRSGKSRVLVMAYAAPRGAQVQLIERGRGVDRVITEVSGVACRGRVPRTLNGQPVLCARVQFQPTKAPAGTKIGRQRKIEALVTVDDIPVGRTRVAKFKAK